MNKGTTHGNESDESILGPDFRQGQIKQTHEVTIDYANEAELGKANKYGVQSNIRR